jgi:hypothetical protein
MAGRQEPDELEFVRPRHRELGGPVAFQNSGHVLTRRSTEGVGLIRSIHHEEAERREVSE